MAGRFHQEVVGGPAAVGGKDGSSGLFVQSSGKVFLGTRRSNSCAMWCQRCQGEGKVGTALWALVSSLENAAGALIPKSKQEQGLSISAEINVIPMSLDLQKPEDA